ncbi:hypothetical protein M3P05_18175 [Sansalvadorimonas sp. 2012CJ34-2]|uniref:Uncharacterized protein n=1 Tax=Parendozoicomonas callyspongiae TaxID=2942213 RepID=A0ABT0PKF2_9GAMM|nr:hypothetical protein [Sansalvadorimonas sp. 2012CJ34-2]MCL6271848.1 hypothetical protein [Sansalvadorimonas sp. 2012CJ34-2]
MSEDIAFRIQLGLILPKIKEKIGSDLTGIVQELAAILQSGSVDSEGDLEADLGAIKEIFMKDIEIYLDKEVMPVISASLAPAQEPEAGVEEGAAEGQEGEAAAEPEE